jgi:hypothetical protein
VRPKPRGGAGCSGRPRRCPLTGLLIPPGRGLHRLAEPEGGATEWFALFRENPIRGLISYDLLILLEEVLLVPIVLALYLLLHRRSESLVLVASAMWFVSIALFIGSNTGFEMLTLAGRHAEAATDVERAAFVASGEGCRAYMGMGTPFVVVTACPDRRDPHRIAMLRRRRSVGLPPAAIVANALGLALFLPGIGTSVAVSVLILVVWYSPSAGAWRTHVRS